MWPLPLFIAIWFAPESPWWLVRKGRVEEAKKSLQRLTSPDRETDFDADETIAMMVHTTALEEKVSPYPRHWDFGVLCADAGQITAGSSYLDCFRGTDLRRTEVSGRFPDGVNCAWRLTTA